MKHAHLSEPRIHYLVADGESGWEVRHYLGPFWKGGSYVVIAAGLDEDVASGLYESLVYSAEGGKLQ